MNNLWKIVLGLSLLALVGCEQTPAEETPTPVIEPTYGYYYFGEEEVPVSSFVTAEDMTFMLKISPLEDVVKATTYAIVGVRTELLGEELNVENEYHNDDYVFIYEDPIYYFAARRPLRSGKILLDRNSAGVVRVDVDVVLYDGTPFRYKNLSLKPQE